MNFEFQSDNPEGIMAAIAKSMDSSLQDGAIKIPEHLGSGYIKGIMINPQLIIMIRQFELKEELAVKRNAMKNGADTVLLSYHNLYRKQQRSQPNRLLLPSVQVTTAEMDYEDLFPVMVNVNTLIIMVHRNLLKSLLGPNEESSFMQSIVSGDRAFLYEEVVSPQMQDIAEEIITAKVSSELQVLFYRIRAEQLIYLLFTELIKREQVRKYPVNIDDVKMIYAIRDKIITDLSVNPKLAELSKYSGISETKMKRLFKQIFGTSIYSYYQTVRMKRAAYLIKEQNLPVSEAGYQIGFSNLSHFTRIFERYQGVKPKKYAKMA